MYFSLPLLFGGRLAGGVWGRAPTLACKHKEREQHNERMIWAVRHVQLLVQAEKLFPAFWFSAWHEPPNVPNSTTQGQKGGDFFERKRSEGQKNTTRPLCSGEPFLKGKKP